MNDQQVSQAAAGGNDEQLLTPDGASDAALVDALWEAVKTRHGERLSPHQLDQVRQGIVTMLETAARLEAYPLTNADEPDFVFRPYTAED